MEGDKDRYFDFSEEARLADDFDPGRTQDLILSIHGSNIQKHLCIKNPVKSIQGLLGYLIVTNAAHSERIEAKLGWLIYLLLANVALMAVIVFALFI